MKITDGQKQLAKDLTAMCKTRERWLQVMRFGQSQLLQDPHFLMWLVVHRALYEQGESIDSGDPPAFIVDDAAASIAETIVDRSIDRSVGRRITNLAPGFRISPLRPYVVADRAAELLEQLGLTFVIAPIPRKRESELDDELGTR